MVKCTGRDLVVKRPGVLSKVQLLTLVFGVGVFSLLPSNAGHHTFRISSTIGAKMITLHNFIFLINFPDYVRIAYITELVWNYFRSCVMSCVVAKHTMWTLHYITELFLNQFRGYVIYLYITELVSN